MHVVIAPDSFKGTATAAEAARALADGWYAARPGDEVTVIPLADGGEGTAEVIAAAVPGSVWHPVRGVRGPDDRPADARWLELPDGTAVVDLATAAGLPMMARLDPLGAHTYGLGQVIADALDHGANQLVIGLGGSASTDGGTGLLAALGAVFLDADGRELPPGGAALNRLAVIDLSGLRTAPPGGISCLTDVAAPLTGPAGAAAVFGPQKGAGPGDVAVLDAGLTRLAALLGGDPAQPGAGAAGGSGYGLAAAWGALLVPGAASVAELAGLPAVLDRADLVITGEGRFDETSLNGKAVGYVLASARAAGTAATVVAGHLTAAPPCPAISLTSLAPTPEDARANPLHWLYLAGTTAALNFIA